MNEYDVMFEDIQSLSDEADALGLPDVALVLEFALDVLLRDRQELFGREPTPVEIIVAAAEKMKDTTRNRTAILSESGGTMPTFPLLEVYRVAS